MSSDWRRAAMLLARARAAEAQSGGTRGARGDDAAFRESCAVVNKRVLFRRRSVCHARDLWRSGAVFAAAAVAAGDRKLGRGVLRWQVVDVVVVAGAGAGAGAEGGEGGEGGEASSLDVLGADGALCDKGNALQKRGDHEINLMLYHLLRAPTRAWPWRFPPPKRRQTAHTLQILEPSLRWPWPRNRLLSAFLRRLILYPNVSRKLSRL
eukprot:scaffold1247_cov251-Pinguiococcus_pyrenoidosus.AAC.4